MSDAFQSARFSSARSRTFRLRRIGIGIASGTSHGLRGEPNAPLSSCVVNIAPDALKWLSPEVNAAKRLQRESLERSVLDLLRRLSLEQTLRKDDFEAMMNGLSLQPLSTVWRALSPVREFEPDASGVSGFHRAFKAVAGISPDAWREQTRS